MTNDSQKTDSDALVKHIRNHIEQRGPVTFRWFMDNALYHPNQGYYSARANPVGKKGDFFTSVSVGSTFGKLMAHQFHEMWLRMGSPMGFAIIEQAANDGQFAADVLAHIQFEFPEMFAELRYVIIEPFETLQIQQKRRLESLHRKKVLWFHELADLETGAFSGVFFSNELLDAFPVHLVTFRENAWHEIYVETTGDGFQLVTGTLSVDSLRRHLGKIGPGVEGQIAEINLKAINWAKNAAAALRAGYLFVIDYGMSRGELYSPERLGGTLRCYKDHRCHRDPFADIGLSDITAHIDFTSVAEAAEEGGLKVIGYTDQHHFLVGASRSFFQDLEQLSEVRGVHGDLATQIREFQMLMHPSTMGMSFRFLLMSRGVPNAEAISGLEFAGDPRAALELAPYIEPEDSYGW